MYYITILLTLIIFNPIGTSSTISDNHLCEETKSFDTN